MIRKAKYILAGAFILLIAFMCARNVRTVKKMLRPLDHPTFREAVAQIHALFPGRIRPRNYYLIDLNGLINRWATELNNVYRLKNGMIRQKGGITFEQMFPERVIAFSDFVRSQGIPFLYVQAPNKTDLQETLQPEGYQYGENRETDRFLEALRAGGIEILDLRETMTATPELVERYFYRTDHHWNTDGAFLGFQIIAEHLAKVFPPEDPTRYAACLEKANWEQHVLPQPMLGNVGQRVGCFYGGVDKVVWYTPKFPTQISCEIPCEGISRSGDYAQATLHRDYYLDRKNFHIADPYYLHAGMNYPLVHYVTPDAPSSRRLVLIHDSFMLATEAYLATCFKEILSIDLRRYHSQGSVTDAIREFKPDLVLQMKAPITLTDDQAFRYGLPETP